MQASARPGVYRLWHSASPLSHALVCLGRPDAGELTVVERDGRLKIVSSTIPKPHPGTHSVSVLRNDGGEGTTALGARESHK